MMCRQEQAKHQRRTHYTHCHHHQAVHVISFTAAAAVRVNAEKNNRNLFRESFSQLMILRHAKAAKIVFPATTTEASSLSHDSDHQKNTISLFPLPSAVHTHSLHRRASEKQQPLCLGSLITVSSSSAFHRAKAHKQAGRRRMVAVCV